MTGSPVTDTGVPPDRLKLRRRSLLQIALLVLLFGAVDCLSVGGVLWGALAVRGVWAAGLVVLALTLPRTDAQLTASSRLVSWISVPAFAVIAHETGGTHGVLYTAFPALPLIAVLFTDPRAARLTTALCVVAVGAQVWLEGGGPSHALTWIVLEVLLGTMAVLGGKHLLDSHALTLQAERQRALAESAKVEALERLATSERRAAHSERLALVGSLASGVAHEINNPLAFAKSSARYLSERLGGVADEETRLAFEDVTVGLARIEQIVRDLRNFSREDREGVSVVGVRTLVDEAVRIASVRLRGAASVQVDVDPTLPELETSPGRIVQVLVNLMVNAADALESADPRPEAPKLWVKAHARGACVELSVEDNGPGIPPAVLPKLFQPFFTTKPAGKGTGLGLAVSQDYCARLGGTLAAENRAEGGARFMARLPLSAPQPSCETPEPAPTRSSTAPPLVRAVG